MQRVFDWIAGVCRVRIKQHEATPDRWFVAGTIAYQNGTEYSFMVLRLPSYQMMQSLLTLRMDWHQLAFRYHGKHGFDFEWLPKQNRITRAART
jgi:hypothetical protein